MEGSGSVKKTTKTIPIEVSFRIPLNSFKKQRALLEKDPSSEELKLIEGMLLTEDRKPYLMNVVRKAERRIQAKKTSYGY